MAKRLYCPSCEEPLPNPNRCGLCGWMAEEQKEAVRRDCDRPTCKRTARVQFQDGNGRSRALCWPCYEQMRTPTAAEQACADMANQRKDWHRRPDETREAYAARMSALNGGIVERVNEQQREERDDLEERRKPADEEWWRTEGRVAVLGR